MVGGRRWETRRPTIIRKHMAHSLSGKPPATVQATHNCILCGDNVSPHLVCGPSISSVFVPAERVKDPLLGWIDHHP